MKIKAFFCYSFIWANGYSGRMVIRPYRQKMNAIHRIHNTQIYSTPLGFCFDVDFIRGLHPCLWAFRPSGTTAAASIKSTLKG